MNTTATPVAKTFKPFSGVTAKEFTAKLLASKATKNTGKEHIAFPCEGGWTVKEVFKHQPAKKVRTPKDPNAWIANAAAALRTRLNNIGLTKEAVTVVEGQRAKVLINGVTATWFTKKEWAEAVVAAI